MQEQRQSNGGGGRGRGRGRGGRGRGRGRGSRGGGQNRGRNNNRNKTDNNGWSEVKNNSNNNNNKTQNRQPRKPSVPNTKKNGEKGADAHTVSEKTRIRFTQILMDFREDESRTKCEFPSDLTNTERKFLHQLALQLGLKSKSHGKGENRKVTVTRPDDGVQQASARGGAEGDALPLLKIGKGGYDALAKHVSRFPLTRMEELESRETGASLVAAFLQQQQQDDNENVLNVLDQLGLGSNGAIDHASHKIHHANIGRRVDTRHRIERHAFYQQKKKGFKDYQQVIRNRAKLPAFSRQEEIVATVAANPVTIIQGGTYITRSKTFLNTSACWLILFLFSTCNFLFAIRSIFRDGVWKEYTMPSVHFGRQSGCKHSCNPT